MSGETQNTTVGKLKRSYLLHYIDASMGSTTPKWFLIGKDIADLSVELNPDTETVKNILDETVTNDNGYEPSISAETYYANTDDSIYEPILNIAMNRLTGDDCKTKVLEVIMDAKAGPYKAWQEDCIIKPQSYGGPQGGVNIPFNISFCGNRQQGTATVTDKVPTFTAKTST
ncbi:MAG: hypothetical protein J1F17_06060 [Oscillospiraceae bacterium]|nr:hypothetical protein [Oscillospiraceae bacterium]